MNVSWILVFLGSPIPKILHLFVQKFTLVWSHFEFYKHFRYIILLEIFMSVRTPLFLKNTIPHIPYPTPTSLPPWATVPLYIMCVFLSISRQCMALYCRHVFVIHVDYMHTYMHTYFFSLSSMFLRSMYIAYQYINWF